jgi:hypothetical protein
MQTNEPAGTDEADIVALDPALEVVEREEATIFARLGIYAVPVVVFHLALLYPLARAAFGELPRLPHADLVIGWLWVNGGALALGAWLWRRGRIPLGAGKWLSGRRARWSIAAWLGASLAWFLLPALLQDAAKAVSGLFPTW